MALSWERAASKKKVVDTVKASPAQPIGRAEVPAPKFRRMGRATLRALRLGPRLLPATKTNGQRPPRDPACPGLQMESVSYGAAGTRANPPMKRPTPPASRADTPLRHRPVNFLKNILARTAPAFGYILSHLLHRVRHGGRDLFEILVAVERGDGGADEILPWRHGGSDRHDGEHAFLKQRVPKAVNKFL